MDSAGTTRRSASSRRAGPPRCGASRASSARPKGAPASAPQSRAR